MSSSKYKETIYGIIPNEWELKKVADYSEVVTDYVANGSFASLKENVKYREEPDVAVLIRLVDYNNNFDGNFVYISEESYNFLRKSKLYGGEIIISNVGANVGTVFKCPNLKCKMSLAPNAIMFRTKGFDDFYYYWLKSGYGQFALKSIVSGSAQPKFNKTDFRNIQIPVPPIEEQKAIAATLSCLDDKIELNNRINKNLEEIAQAIFKSWFVNFELFQDGEFEDSELGRIPKGWNIFTVNDVVLSSSTGGDAIQKTPIVDYDTGIKCVRVGDLSNQREVDGWGYCNVNEENLNKYQLKKNDIIVTRTATLGLNQIIDEDLMAVFNNGLIRLKLNEKVIPLFFYHVLNTDMYKEYIGCIESESSTRPNMKINYLLKYKFICPPLKVQQKFLDIVKDIREQRLNLRKQTNVLADLRDSLLPKLMSGEIRVPIEEVQ